MNCVCAILLLLYTLASAESHSGETSEMEVDLSDLVDAFLPYISEIIQDNGLDPLPLPDINGTFKETVMLIPLDVAYYLQVGKLYGASKFNRNRPTVVVNNKKQLRMEVGIEFPDLSISFSCCAKVPFLSYRCGDLSANMSKLNLDVVFTYDGKKDELSLHRFEIDPQMEIFLKTDNSLFPDSATQLLLTVLESVIKEELVGILESTLVKEIDKQLVKSHEALSRIAQSIVKMFKKNEVHTQAEQKDPQGTPAVQMSWQPSLGEYIF